MKEKISFIFTGTFKQSIENWCPIAQLYMGIVHGYSTYRLSQKIVAGPNDVFCFVSPVERHKSECFSCEGGGCDS
jgi:hypothetical protein